MQVEGPGSVLPLDVLEAFGIPGASTIEPMPGGKQNTSWRVSTGPSGDRIIRRYAPARSREAIAWEHELLAYAKQRGWPVAVPRRARGGATFVSLESGAYALFPHLPGEPLQYASIAGKALKGRLLARLHHDLRHFPNDGQRPGFARTWELDVFASQSAGLSFHQLVATLTARHNDAGYYLRGQRYYNLRELARLGYGELPTIPVNNDFQNAHILFEEGELTGLLDFDSACTDAAEVDLASAITLECLAPPAYNELDLAAVSAFARAYFEHRPPQESTPDLVVALIRARYLRRACARLAEWHVTGSDQALASVLRTAEHRLPALSRQRHDLRAALIAAAHE